MNYYSTAGTTSTTASDTAGVYYYPDTYMISWYNAPYTIGWGAPVKPAKPAPPPKKKINNFGDTEEDL